MYKFLLTIVSLILLSGIPVSAKVGDVYYCVVEFHKGVENYIDDEGLNEKNYTGIKFTFKRTENEILFNKDADNHFSDIELSVIRSYNEADELLEIFEAKSKTSHLNYENGGFYYTINWGKLGISYLYANCDLF